MIQTLEIVNSYGEKLPIDLRNPEASGYVISGMNGLGPVDVDIKQTQMVSGLKYKYNKGFHKYRDITIQFIFYEWNNNNFSIDRLRRDLIYFLQTDDLITLYFVKDNGDVRKIQGYVSKHDAAYFSNACGAQVTVTCPDPWFVKVTRDDSHEDRYYMLLSQLGENSMTVSFEAHEGYDEDLTEVDIPFGTIACEYSATFNYDGSIVSGMRIEFADDINNTKGVSFNILSNHYKLGNTGEMTLKEPNDYSIVDIPTSRPTGSFMIYSPPNPGNDRIYTATVDSEGRIIYTDPYTIVSLACIKRDASEQENPSTQGHTTIVRSELISENNKRVCYDTRYPDDYTNSTNYLYALTYTYNGSEYVRDTDHNLFLYRLGDGTDNIYVSYDPPSTKYNLQIDTGYDFLSVIANADDENKNQNVIGWVDYSSITKRKNLPSLYQGANTIVIRTSEPLANTGNVAKIYFRTLYREV